MAKRFKLRDGCEVRGFKLKIYPTPEQEIALRSLQSQLRFIWNCIVGDWNATYKAREGWAVKNGIEPPAPDDMDKDDRIARRKRINAAAKDVPGLQSRSVKDWMDEHGYDWDYHLFQRMLSWVKYPWPDDRTMPHAHILQGLGWCLNESQYSVRPKKTRKRDDEMSLLVRSRECLQLGTFGKRRGNDFYNCQISINGIKILGRLPGKEPTGRLLQGVALSKLADGWYAAIREELPIREMKPAKPGLRVGVDVGKVDLVALSDGTRITNKRDRKFTARIAERQKLDLPVGRLQLRAKRHMKQKCYELARDLGEHELVAVEALPKNIGTKLNTGQVSLMRTVSSVLKQRLGDRVREVNPAYTSQECSQCGKKSAKSWGHTKTRRGKCLACGYEENRDVNAARNVLRRAEESLGIPKDP